MPRDGQEMPDKAKGRQNPGLTRCGVRLNPGIPQGHHRLAVPVLSSRGQCLLSVLGGGGCAGERVCEPETETESRQQPGSWLAILRFPSSYRPPSWGRAARDAGVGAPRCGGRGTPGSSLPTFLKLLTVMAKPLVRGSRWYLRLGSPLAWATCMLIWCFFSVNRVPSQ